MWHNNIPSINILTYVLQFPCLTPNLSANPRPEHWQRQSRGSCGAGANTWLLSLLWGLALARAATARQPRRARAMEDFIFKGKDCGAGGIKSPKSKMATVAGVSYD